MALEKRTISIPFSQGMDTKDDAFRVPLGKWLSLVNATFIRPGKLSKRNGYAALTSSILGGGSLTAATALMTRGNEMMIADGTGSFYSYDQNNAGWCKKNGTGLPVQSITTTITAGATSQYTLQCIDVAQAANGLQCFVFEIYDQSNSGSVAASRVGIGYSLVDSGTGQVVVPTTTLDATAYCISPHVVLQGANFVIYYLRGDLAATADIFVRTISSTSPLTAPSAATQITSGAGASTQQLGVTGAFNFDVIVANGTIYVSFNNRAGGTTIFLMTNATTVGTTASIAATGSLSSCIVADVDGAHIMLGYITAAAASVAVYTSALGVSVASQIIDNAFVSYTSITGISTAANSNIFYIGNGSLTATAQLTRTNTMTGAGYTVGTASTLVRSLQPAAKACLCNGAAYLPAWYGVTSLASSSPQTTLFLVDSGGSVLSRAMPGTTGGPATMGGYFAGLNGTPYQLPASTVTSTTVLVPASRSLRIDSIIVSPSFGVSVNSQFGAVGVNYNFADTTNNYTAREAAAETHINGGALALYDGATVTEHGFNVYPSVTATAGGGGSGSLSAGTYQYLATYEWMDAQGQIHTSVPSSPISLTTVATDSGVVVISALRATSKTGVRVNVYRTAVNGTIFRLVNNFATVGTLYNTKTADSVTWTDTLSDTAIASYPQIYTTGGVLANDPPPPAGPTVVHRNRLFVVDSTNPLQVWYSKQIIPPAPVEFSGFQVLNIDPKGGPVTALGSMDDKLIVFKSDRIGMILGQGPDATGGQNDYTDWLPISTDTGCAQPKSVINVPDGLMFMSPKGIYLLTRSLGVQYIGAPIEGQITTVLGALLLPDRNQVWFVPSLPSIQDPVYVYDYYAEQWSQFRKSAPTLNYAGLVVWQGTVVRAHTDGSIWQETIGTYADPGNAYIPMSGTSAWIKVAGLQGFQRVWTGSLLGNYTGSAGFRFDISIAYDYAASGTSLGQIVTTAAVTPWQYQLMMPQQKCEAIQLTFAESARTTPDIGPTLSGLDLEIGVKRGTRKLAASQSTG